MRLMHFSRYKVDKIRSTAQRSTMRDGTPLGKPVGFWVSDEDGHGWKAWCKDNDFATNRFVYSYDIELAPEANILYLRNVDDLENFTNEYELKGGYLNRDSPILPGRRFIYEIDWKAVAKKYQGIIITPYVWSWDDSRMMDMAWYYGWDCASGCIWDARAIKSVIIAREEVPA